MSMGNVDGLQPQAYERSASAAIPRLRHAADPQCCAEPKPALDRQRQLLVRRRLLGVQRRQGDAEQPYAKPHRQQRCEQLERGAFQHRHARHEIAKRPAARDLLEVGVLYFQRHGPPPRARPLAMLPHLLGQRAQLITHGSQGGQVLEKGVLGADRLADAVGPDRALVHATRDPVVVGATPAELLLQERHALRPQVEPGADAEPVHLGRRHRADGMEPAHIEGLDEGGAAAGRDHEQPVRLAVVGGELGEELVIGHPGRGGQPRPFANAGPDRLGDLRRRRDALQVLGDVEVGLVQRQWLDDGRVLGEHGADLLRHCLVHVEARPDEDQLGAFPPRRDPGHGRSHAEAPGLVARRRHDAALARAAHRDGLAAQGGVVALLHGRVEGIHVDVDDLALTLLRLGDRFRGEVGRVQHGGRLPARDGTAHGLSFPLALMSGVAPWPAPDSRANLRAQGATTPDGRSVKMRRLHLALSQNVMPKHHKPPTRQNTRRLHARSAPITNDCAKLLALHDNGTVPLNTCGSCWVPGW